MGLARKKVVLHVGAHKTGTTVFQEYLRRHPGTLRRGGIRYLTRPELTPAVGWGDVLVDRPAAFAGMLDDFAAGPQHTLLASHENTCGHPFRPGEPGLYPSARAPIRALHRLVEGFDVRILLTIRPQHELVESYYLQTVHLGGREPFSTWFAGLDTHTLHWTPLVGHLRSAFGDDAVSVVDFGEIRRGAPHYVAHLLGRAGIDIPIDRAWIRSANPSVSGQGLRMALRGNAVLPDPADRVLLRRFLQRHFNNTVGSRPVLLGDGIRAELAARYGAEYADLVAAPLPGAT